MKKAFLNLIIGFIFSGILITSLYFNSKRIDNKANGFVRKISDHSIYLVRKIALKGNAWLFAGTSQNLIYLRSKKFTNILDIVNWKDQKSRLTIIESPTKIKFDLPILTVDSPNFYISDGSKFYSGTERNWTLNYINEFPHFATDLIQIGKYTLVARWYDRNRGWTLGTNLGSDIKTLSIGNINKDSTDLLSDDSILAYSKKLKSIVVLSYYKNCFMVIDSNLNTFHKFKTIDTVMNANLKVSVNKNKVQLSSPTIPINRQMSVDSTFMYVRSSLRADNETIDTHKNKTVIDKYDLQSGVYLFSFYVPEQQGEKLLEFRIVGDKIYTLYDSGLVVYKMFK